MSVLARPPVADPRLVRAYGRLVRFYPRGPRRDELLDTLVECAAPGRRRPSVREVLNLAWHGSRARLGRPASRGIVVLAVFVALATGFLGAAAANRLAWEAVGPLPAGAEAAEIRDTIFPGLTVWGGGDAAKFAPQLDGEGIAYGHAVSWVKHTAETRDVDRYTAATRARLEAAGWRVTSVDPPLDETDMVGANPGDRAAGFTAVRGGLGLRFTDSYWPGRPAYDSDGSASFLVWHRTPGWVTAAGWAGAVPAAVLAWLLTGWVSRRLTPNRSLSSLAAAGGLAYVLGLVPAELLAIPFDPAQDETAAPFWSQLLYLGAGPAHFSAAAAVLVLAGAVAYRLDLRRRLWARVALIVAAVLVCGLVVYRVSAPRLSAGSCTPTVPSGVVDPPGARLSYLSRVFISPQATADQRNLVQAAIGRAFGGGMSFHWEPGTADFAEAYCPGGRIPAAAVRTLPYFWAVDLESPGLFAGLAAEVVAMPGVVAVQHVPPS